MSKLLLPLLLSATLWGYGDWVVYWAPHPGASDKKPSAVHQGHGMKEKNVYTAMHSEGNVSVTLIQPDLSRIPLPLIDNSVSLPKPKSGGYYALVLNQHSDKRIENAIRYLSLQGRPAKVSPAELTALPKTDLEIAPHPLHREHDRYTGSKTYRFIVTFKKKFVANTPILLETCNHTSLLLRSGPDGVVQVTLPNDFYDVTAEKGDKTPSEFLLHTRYQEGKTLHITTLSMPYYPNPNDYWQSQSWGTAAVIIGFLGGMILYRRMKKGANHG